jgi:hypothetical protein
MPNLRAAFRTTVSGEGRYEMVFKFPSMDALHKADDEWRALSSRPDAGEAVKSGDLVDLDTARLALFDAIRSIKIGNVADDKLILDNLRKAGFWICRIGDFGSTVANVTRSLAHPPAAVAGGQPLRQALIQDAIDNGDHGKVARMALSQPAADAVGTGEYSQAAWDEGAAKLISEAAKLVEPKDGEAVFYIRVGGSHTSMTVKSKGNVDPDTALQNAIAALNGERGDLSNCPVHHLSTPPRQPDDAVREAAVKAVENFAQEPHVVFYLTNTALEENWRVALADAFVAFATSLASTKSPDADGGGK